MSRARHAGGAWPAGLVGGVALFLLSTQLGCGSPDAERAARRPNVVVILADDFGWRDSAVYGSAFYETPNIDRLASEGIRFTDAYSASPLCSPTRAGLLTGLDPGRLRFTLPAGHEEEVILEPGLPERGPPEERAVAAGSRTRLPLEVRTTAEVLREAGYATAMFGKWHLGAGAWGPEHQGFDVVMPQGGQHAPRRYLSPWQMPGLADGPKGEHLDQRLAREAARFVRLHPDEPFFLCFWPFSVHFPFEADPTLLAKYQRKADPGASQRFPNMGAMIESLDVAVGILLAAVDASGRRDDTVVLFLSDNGGVDQNYDGSVSRPPPTDNAPLRGGKGQLYEGGIRIPLIMRWPGRIDAGATSSEVVTTTDLHPTILELAGLAPPDREALDGISLLPSLAGLPLVRKEVFFHFPHYMPRDTYRPSSAVRRGRFKLIRFHADGEAGRDRFELYDLETDLGETRDQSRDRPALVGDLDAAIDRYLADTGALVPFANPAYRARGD